MVLNDQDPHSFDEGRLLLQPPLKTKIATALITLHRLVPTKAPVTGPLARTMIDFPHVMKDPKMCDFYFFPSLTISLTINLKDCNDREHSYE